MTNLPMILCFSGGLDSLIAWHYLGKPQCIYFDCNSYSGAEREAVFQLNPNCIIDSTINLSDHQTGVNAYIPHRNMIFAALASRYSGVVVMAGVKDDVVEDKNPAAFHVIGQALTYTAKNPVSVISPFWDMTKAQVVRWFIENVDNAEELMDISVSCYNNQKYCGACPSCFRKANALWENGIKKRFNDEQMMLEYYHAAIREDYDESRNKSIRKFYAEHLKWTSELDDMTPIYGHKKGVLNEQILFPISANNEELFMETDFLQAELRTHDLLDGNNSSTKDK